jgi:signal transduction histidine kinase
LLCDREGVMRFAASRGLSETYRRAVEGHSPWTPGETNPQPVCIDDVTQTQLPPGLREVIEREGIRALAFIPLTYEKRLLGKFMIYYAAPHAFTPAAMRPVETLASQVAFAIERQRSAEALEALVDERTMSLRQAVAQMEEFSYSVSHDLRAPVRAMRGFAEIIMQDHASRLDDQGRELLGRILRNSGRMDRLIQDLLTYSRISRRELQFEPVSLDKLVQEVVQEYPDMRPERADIEVQGPLPMVLAHEPSLTQVVSNLLSNAVKFVPPEARPRVRIGFDKRAAQARLWFEDNGIGIKPEHQQRLFRMFERMHPDKPYEGTGIGLAIVRKAVERMNGSVGVESDGVRGSKFWFELPIAPN